MDDRIEYIKKLQASSFKREPQQSAVMGNFYALITIVVVCLSLLYFSNYIMPQIQAKKQKELQAQKHQKFLDERAKRIALSHKLNAKEYEMINQESDKNATK